jgi:hypothetical protein
MPANVGTVKFNGKDRTFLYASDEGGRHSYWVQDIEFGGDCIKYRSSDLDMEKFISSIETKTLKHSGDIDEEYGEIGFNDSALIGKEATKEARSRRKSTICVTVSRFYPKIGLDMTPESNVELLEDDDRLRYTAKLLRKIVREVENPDNFR